MSPYLWVGLGSALGGTLRYAVDVLFAAIGAGGFPWATLIINVTGCLVIGLYDTLTGPDGRLYAPVRIRQFVMIGVCGGYTTFSSFSLETLDLARAGRLGAAGSYFAMSLVLCLIGVWLGHALSSRINRLA